MRGITLVFLAAIALLCTGVNSFVYDFQYNITALSLNNTDEIGVPDGHSGLSLVLKAKAFNYTDYLTGLTLTAPANSILYFGSDSLRNDVWYTSDHGYTFHLIAGIGYDVNASVTTHTITTAYPVTFPAEYRTGCVAHDASTNTSLPNYDRVYKLGGHISYGNSSGITDLYYTDDAVTWINATTLGYSKTVDKSEALCGVTQNGTILWFSGCALFSWNGINECQNPTNDVYRSDNFGFSWQLVTASAAFAQRSGAAGGVVRSQYTAQKDLLYVIGGYVTNTITTFADIWVSSDLGNSFQMITGSASFGGRAFASFAATQYGVMVYGLGETGYDYYRGDIFCSIDGGYTWYEINAHESPTNAISARITAAMVVDELSFFIITGGRQAVSTYVRDRSWYRSSQKLNTAALWLPASIDPTYINTMPPWTANDPVNFRCVGMSVYINSTSRLCDNNPVTPGSFGYIMQSWGPFPGKNSMYAFRRNSSSVYYDPATFAAITAPANSLFVLGGYNGEASGGSYVNDVWTSSDHGVTWKFVAGLTYNLAGAYQLHSYSPVSFVAKEYQCFTSDVNGVMYALGGLNLPAATVPVTSNAVYRSTDGTNWVTVSITQGFPARAEHSCWADSQGRVYVGFGCSDYTNSVPAAGSCTTLSDIWRSSDYGVTWNVITPANASNAPPSRAQDISTIYINTANSQNVASGGRDLIYVLGGYVNTSSRSYTVVTRNDIWVSSDFGVNWLLISSAPYAGASGLYGGKCVISSEGIMVVAGGAYNSGGFESSVVYSMDGGFTFYIIDATGGSYWNQRIEFGMVLDELGYLYTIGGLTAGTLKRENGVYRSTLPAVGASMSLWAEGTGGGRFTLPVWNPKIPSRCLGLICWPGMQCVCGPANSTVEASGQLVGSFTWKLQEWAAFSGRQRPHIFQKTSSFVYNALNATGYSISTTVVANSFVMFGGSLKNDLYYSSTALNPLGNDKDGSWYIVTGVDGSTYSAYNVTWTALDSMCYTHDSAGRIYALGGQTNNQNNLASSVAWTSSDLVHWTSNSGSGSAFTGKSEAVCGTDTNKYVYIWSGCQANSLGSGTCFPSNSIYKSQDSGSTWTVVTPTTTYFSARAGSQSVIALANGGTIQSDFMYTIGGYNYVGQSLPGTVGTQTFLQDVWVSSTGGTTWSMLTATPAFGVRANGQLAVSSQGYLVLAGGIDSTLQPKADSWISFDGGYYWAVLASNPQYTLPYNPTGWYNRQLFSMWFDSSDNLWVSSGSTNLATPLASDVWKTSISLVNGADTWMKTGIYYPAGYVYPVNKTGSSLLCTGLYCFPGQQCSCGPAVTMSSSSSSSTGGSVSSSTGGSLSSSTGGSLSSSTGGSVSSSSVSLLSSTVSVGCNSVSQPANSVPVTIVLASSLSGISTNPATLQAIINNLFSGLSTLLNLGTGNFYCGSVTDSTGIHGLTTSFDSGTTTVNFYLVSTSVATAQSYLNTLISLQGSQLNQALSVYALPGAISVSQTPSSGGGGGLSSGAIAGIVIGVIVGVVVICILAFFALSSRRSVKKNVDVPTESAPTHAHNQLEEVEMESHQRETTNSGEEDL